MMTENDVEDALPRAATDSILDKQKPTGPTINWKRHGVETPIIASAAVMDDVVDSEARRSLVDAAAWARIEIGYWSKAQHNLTASANRSAAHRRLAKGHERCWLGRRSRR